MFEVGPQSENDWSSNASHDFNEMIGDYLQNGWSIQIIDGLIRPVC